MVFRVGRGVGAGVGGKEKSRLRVEGRRVGKRSTGGRLLGRGRRKVLHSVQVQEMFSLERGVASISNCVGGGMVWLYMVECSLDVLRGTWGLNELWDVVGVGGMIVVLQGSAMLLFANLFAARRLSSQRRSYA